MANNGGGGFILTTKFYKIANYTTVLVPKKSNPEGKASAQTEGTAIKKQEQMENTQLETQKIHSNKLHTKLGHPI